MEELYNNPHFKRRLIVIGIFLGLFILYILYGYFTVMVQKDTIEFYTPINLPAVRRGTIYDRNGRVLAVQLPSKSVTMWGPSVQDAADLAAQLAPILDLKEEDLYNKIANTPKFAYLKRKISELEAFEIQTLLEDAAIPGIFLQDEFSRHYPEGSLASHIVGYVNIDNIGLSGIEYTFNNVLTPGEIDENGNYREPYDVYLTIDVPLQHYIEKLAKETQKEHNADSVMMLISDAKTGELLAYASTPDFDPNNLNKASNEDLRNRPILMNFEPGSVFKIFSVASFLELGGINENTVFNTNGIYEGQLNSGDTFKIRESSGGSHGRLTPELILKKSSNVGSSYAADTATKGEFYFMLQQFGFGQKTGIPLNGESRGQLRSPANWSPRSKPTISFGQEIGVTALQIQTAATAISNDGVLLKPQLRLKLTTNEGEIVQNFAPETVRQVISPETARLMLDMLTSTTEPDGTAKRAAVEGLSISAKTGTAEMLDRETGTYSEEAYVASCLAIFPSEDPRYIVYTVIEYPKGDQVYGGQIAAPVVKEGIEYLIRRFDVDNDRSPLLNLSETISLEQEQLPALGDVMPDLTGLSKRTLMGLYAYPEYTITIKGSGWVKKQTPAAGTDLSAGTEILLELE